MISTTTGVPYDVCPLCGKRIIPSIFGGGNHLNEHRISEANRLLAKGKSIETINSELAKNGIILFSEIPPKIKDVTKKTKFLYGGNIYHIQRFDAPESIVLKAENPKQQSLYILFNDKEFFSKAIII